jgi:EmrB/QacA subfamily drug resistance transporter
MNAAAALPRARISPGTVAAIAYVGAVGMTAIDNQIVNVALPSIGRGFTVPLADVQWVVVGYALSLAVVMPASGWIGDRFGTKRTLLFALLGFTVASALCGVAGTLVELVGARVLQGICGGLLTPAGTALLFRAFPSERRAHVMRLVIVPILVAPTVAPMLGGILTKALSWRWVFYVNLPVGVLLAIVIVVYLEEYRREGEPGPLDLPALIGSALGLTALLYGISEGATLGWGSPSIIGAGLLGVVIMAWFTRRELKSRHPVLDLRLLQDRLFRASLVVIGLSSASFMGMLYLVPVFLQEADHQSPIASGTTTFVEALGVFVASQTVTRLYPRLGPRVMSTLGSIGVCLILAWMMLGSPGTSLWIVRIQMFLMGGANSVTLLAVQSSVFTNISHERTAHASAIFVTQRQTALAVGIAILTCVVSSVGGPEFHRFHAAFLAAAALAALAAITAFTLIHTSDALPSMRSRVAPEAIELAE